MTEVTRKDNIMSRGLQGCHRSEMSVLVHLWATSLQANSLLYGTTDIPAQECTSLYICGLRVCKQTRFCMEPPTSLSLLNSVLPCTLFNVEFAEQTRYCSISRTSLSVLKSLSPLAFLKIACPEVYIRVHFRTRVFAVQKHRC